MKMKAGFLCWKPSDAQTVVAEAVTPLDSVFLATHRPTRIFRQRLGTTDPGEPCTEEQLLSEFLAPGKELVLMPIIGQSGTGKSHLVRWLRAAMGSDPSRAVVYVPKLDTNLRKVIELILQDVHGSEIDSLRRDLRDASDSLSEAEAPQRLLFELAVRITSLGSDGVRPSTDPQRRYLVKHFPKLLTDAVFQDHLLAAKGVIARMVNEVIHGKLSEDKDRPFEFTIDDIPKDVREVAKAGEAAKETYRQLIGSEKLQQAAADLLNEELAPAIRNLFGMPGTRLFDVMIDVRKALKARNMELCLLIEDFTQLQGIQRELLEGLIEPATRDGKQLLCPIRTAMAVTTGYFDSLDTVRTRASFGGYQYSLDVPYGTYGEDDWDYIVDFVGAYMNTVRLGRAAVEKAYRDTSTPRRSAGGWIPNACDNCRYRELCHGAFGRTSDGFGLYPLNVPAIRRMVVSRNHERFDPRDVLAWVVRDTLEGQADDLRRGAFPSAEFIREFSDPDAAMDPQVASDIVKIDKKDGPRRVRVLTYWGNAPATPINLEATIHDAFDLPRLTAFDRPLAPVRRDESVRIVPEPIDGRSEELAQDLQEIRRWGNSSQPLSQGLAAKLRRHIHASVVASIDWNQEFWRENAAWVGAQDGRFFSQGSVDIESAVGGREKKPEAISIKIARTIDNAVLFGGVVQFLAKHNWTFERGSEAQRSFEVQVRGWAAELLGHVRSHAQGGQAWEPIAPATRLLLVSAVVLNIPGALGPSDADRMRALLADSPAVDTHRGEAWRRLVAACRGGDHLVATRDEVRRLLLERAAAAQGDGQAQLVDAATLSAIVREMAISWKLEALEGDAPPTVSAYQRGIEKALPLALREERDRLVKWRDLTEPAIEGATKALDILEAFAELLAAAQPLGVSGSVVSALRLNELSIKAKTLNLGALDHVTHVINTIPAEPNNSSLPALATDRDAEIDDLKEFVETLARAIDEIQANVATSLRARRPAGGHTETSPGGAVLEILDRLTASLTSLTEDGS
jgi:hypothetical protein